MTVTACGSGRGDGRAGTDGMSETGPHGGSLCSSPLSGRSVVELRSFFPSRSHRTTAAIPVSASSPASSVLSREESAEATPSCSLGWLASSHSCPRAVEGQCPPCCSSRILALPTSPTLSPPFPSTPGPVLLARLLGLSFSLLAFSCPLRPSLCSPNLVSEPRAPQALLLSLLPSGAQPLPPQQVGTLRATGPSITTQVFLH